MNRYTVQTVADGESWVTASRVGILPSGVLCFYDAVPGQTEEIAIAFSPNNWQAFWKES